MKIPSPCFVLDESKLIQNLKLINSVQKKAGIEIILAFKGFAMWGAFSIVKKYVRGATASSLNEVKLCNEEMGVKSHTYCVAYTDEEFDQIVSASSHLTFNSIGQYNKFISRVPVEVSVGLRINPEWSDVETDLYNPSSPVSRLGISSKELIELPERVDGLHFHVLCESDSYALEKVLESLENRFGHLLPKIKWVNMGGGHLMTSQGYDTDHLINLLRAFKEKHKVDIILEPGSAFAWQTGDLHSSILDIVDNGGKKTAIFDGSFTCHMPDCLEMPYRPKLEKGSNVFIDDWHPYRLGGISCLAGDFLDEYWFEKPLQIGDSIVFKDMIHYTMVKTSTFNGVKHPSIGILKTNGDFELLREFGYEDFKNRLS
ncbi:carboxynorspermidine decarboxylase [Ekhidna sp.]|uniref:carboxynorspermidine decarboxylase n=1 Tax=Ekhidna sp. TaxID=2608089 RepID=UPI003B512716